MDNEIIKKLKLFIKDAKKYANIKDAYLYGSYATNTNKPDSDIDIALITDNLDFKSKFYLQSKLLFIASKFDNRIEPFLINKNDFNADLPLSKEILKYGRKIS